MKNCRRYFAKFILFISIVVSCFILQCKPAYAKGAVTVEYRINNEEAIPGKECTLTFIIRNVSELDIHDVLLTVGATDKIYPVYGSSNQLHVDKIKSGKQVEIEYVFNVRDSGDDMALLPVSVTFIDEENQNAANSVVLAIPIGKACELSIKNINVNDIAYINERTLISIDYSNTGDLDIKNLVMHIEGSTEESNKEISLGTLLIGKQKYDDIYTTFYNIGEQVVKIFFTYIDENDIEYESSVYEYTVNVNESDFLPIQLDDVDSSMPAYELLFVSASLIFIILIIKLVSKLKKDKGR